MNARGIVPNNVYNRYNFTIRNTAELVEDKLTLDLSAQYMRQYDRNMLVQGQFHNPLIPIYLFPRSEDVEKYKLFERYDPVAEYYKQFWPAEYGDLQMGAENPWWIVNRELFENNRDRYMISASMQWKITDYLTLSGRIRDDINQNTYTRKIYASSDTKYASKYGNYLNRKRTDKNLYADAMLNFDKRFGRFDINVTLGASLADAKNDLTSYEGHLVRVPNLLPCRTSTRAIPIPMVCSRAITTRRKLFLQQRRSVITACSISTCRPVTTGRRSWPSRPNSISFIRRWVSRPSSRR